MNYSNVQGAESLNLLGMITTIPMGIVGGNVLSVKGGLKGGGM